MKINVRVKRNCIEIQPFYMKKNKNYSPTSEPTSLGIEYSLSIYDPVYKGSKLFLDCYDKDNRTLTVTRGFNLETIISELNKNGDHMVEVTYDDTYNNPFEIKGWNMKFQPRNQIQKDSIDFLLNESNYLKFLSLNVGMGKTYCCVNALQQLKLTSLIMSYNLSDQWVERILQYTDLRRDDIYIIKGSESINKIIKENKRYQIYVVSTSTMTSYINNGGDINELIDYLGVGVKVFDETHSLFKQNMKLDTLMNTKYTFYLSATPGRSDSSENKIFKNLFKEVPIFGVETHTSDDHYTIYLINVNTMPTYNEARGCFIKRGRFLHVAKYFRYIFSTTRERRYYYMGTIKRCLDRLFDRIPESKVAIILFRLEDIKTLRAFLMATDKKKRYNIGDYSSNTPDKYRKNELRKNVILTTVGAFGEGVDVEGLNGIMSLSPFVSSIVNRQLLGRLRNIKNKNVFYYDFIDVGFDRMLSQRERRLKELAPRAVDMKRKTFTSEYINKYLNDILSNKK